MIILSLEDQLKQYIIKNSISSDEKIAIAVSGGSDSLGLSLLASRIFSTENIQLVTIDHDLRKESANESHQVGKWADSYGLAHEILLWKKNEIRGNLLQCARVARYGLLKDYCVKHNIKYLFLGHTLDDQIETFFINLERGSGIDGLSGMEDISSLNEIFICRPLLAATREEIREFLQSINQSWIDDPTNDNEKYLRIKIRNLFKDDKSFYHRMNLALENLRRTKNFVKNCIDSYYCEIVHHDLAQIKYFDRTLYASLDDEVRFRLLNKIIKDLTGDARNQRFDSIKRVDDKIKEAQFKNYNLSGLGISSKKNLIYFYPLIQEISRVKLCSSSVYDIGNYKIHTGEIPQGLELGFATNKQFAEFKKSKKSFPSTSPCNMILNVPVVFKLEKIIMIPHMRCSGDDDIAVEIKSKD